MKYWMMIRLLRILPVSSIASVEVSCNSLFEYANNFNVAHIFYGLIIIIKREIKL